jgi:DNA-binding CsgD family transcriptional regulator
MSDDNVHANSDGSNGRCEPEKFGLLLAAVAQISDAHAELPDRRRELVKSLVELTSAAVGIWAWGVSDDAATSVAPIVSVDIGFTPVEKTAMVQMGLDPSMHEEFRLHGVKLMESEGRSQCTLLRTDLYGDQQWKETRMYSNLAAGGLNEWVNSVRYSQSRTWANLMLIRRGDTTAFEPADRQLVDMAMENIHWLGATLDNTSSADSAIALTSRQRIVLMMQLDGLSRKQIATRLEIGTDTVGDHIKKIYEHFKVNSAGELAALFLRKR